MAKYEDGCYGSLKGIALIGKVLAGRCKMHYTRVAVGKGQIPEGVSPKELEEPPEYVMDAMIASVTNPVDGECQVSVQINSAKVEKGYYAKWLILYAEDPDEGEVPYTALCLENEPEWIRPASSIVGKLAHFDIIAAVGDVDEVYASIDPDALVTADAVERLISDHNKDPEAHADIRMLVNQALESAHVVISKEPPEKGPVLWFCDGDFDPSPRELVATLILGDEGDESDVLANVDGKDHPVVNATREETESGEAAVTIG